LPHAQDVFAVARGNKVVRSFAGRAELAFQGNDVRGATEVLAQAPGMLVRQVDRLLRNASEQDVPFVVDAVREAVPAVSGRVLCSLLQHLENREEVDAARVFATRHRRAWITYDTRMPLAHDVVRELTGLLEDELVRRLPEVSELVVADEVRDIVLPLSGNASEDGFGVLPRGSRVRLEGDLLRFFVYWRQKVRATDYDLSAVLLNGRFDHVGQVSWTNHRQGGAYYSGDLTSARDGATEFIDVPRAAAKAKFVVPQVNIYGGEGFTEVAESMFGFMSRDLSQRGKPFEPSTVRARSAMRGYGNVAVPVVFERTDDAWVATWLHLYLRGTPWANQVENNRDIARQLARGVLSRKYFTVGRLAGLMSRKTTVDGLRLRVDLTNVDQLDKLLEPTG
jgi:hypothetical protein